VTDVPGVHDDEPPDEAVPRGPLVVARLGRDRPRVDPVRDDAKPLGRRSFRLEPVAHGLTDRDDAVRTAQVRADEPSEHADHRGIPKSVELGRDLREHVLADDENRRSDALADEHAEVADDRRIGHAQHEVGCGARECVAQRRPEIREVVHGAPAELRALVRGRGDPDDANPVVLDLPRLVLVPVQDARDDLHLVVLRERLAELGEEVCGRLDAGPVVLVQDENALPGHAIRLPPIRDRLSHGVEESLHARPVAPVGRELP
jgi:hypothetical protein